MAPLFDDNDVHPRRDSRDLAAEQNALGASGRVALRERCRARHDRCQSAHDTARGAMKMKKYVKVRASR